MSNSNSSAAIAQNPVLCARLSRLSLFIDDVSDFMKREKELFTEKYFKDKKPETMSFIERKEMYSEYQKQWAAKEDELYKLLAS